MIGRDGPPFDVISFGSSESGVPGFFDPAKEFTLEPAKTRITKGLDSEIRLMVPGERRIVIVPASAGYGQAGFYPPQIPGQKRFVVSPNVVLIYEVEVLE